MEYANNYQQNLTNSEFKIGHTYNKTFQIKDFLTIQIIVI